MGYLCENILFEYIWKGLCEEGDGYVFVFEDGNGLIMEIVFCFVIGVDGVGSCVCKVMGVEMEGVCYI